MRIKVLISILVLTLIACNKDEITDLQSKFFIKHFDITYLDDVSGDIDLDSDEGYVFTGTTADPALNTTDIILIKTDRFGNQVSWSPYIMKTDGDDQGNAVLCTDDGYIIAGSVNGRIILKKIGRTGTEIWVSSYSVQGVINDLAIGDDKIYAAGYLGDPSSRRPLRAVFDLSGNNLDNSSPVDSMNGAYFTSLAQAGEVSLLCGTQYTDQVSGSDISIIEHAHAEGSFSTEAVPFRDQFNEKSGKVIPLRQGGFFVIGTSTPLLTGSSKIFLKKLDQYYHEDNTFSYSGLESVQTLTGGDFQGIDAAEMTDGSIAVLANRKTTSDTNIMLIFISKNGDLISHKSYGSSGDQTGTAIKATSGGGLIILGNNSFQNNSMMTLIRTDSKGLLWE